jgi:6-phosphogluconolactonase
VVANWVEKLQSQRITLSYPAINSAAQVLFMVAGEDKAAPLWAVLEGNAEIEDIPARGIAPSEGELSFFVDRTAAAGLQSP